MTKKDRRQRFHGMAFPSGALMSHIPITPEYAHQMIARVREQFHRSDFRPKLRFDHRASGPWGRLGEANRTTDTITIWQKGMNVETLLHEIAHMLTRGGHNKEFYFACELLEREFFYCKLPD